MVILDLSNLTVRLSFGLIFAVSAGARVHYGFTGFGLF